MEVAKILLRKGNEIDKEKTIFRINSNKKYSQAEDLWSFSLFKTIFTNYDEGYGRLMEIGNDPNNLFAFKALEKIFASVYPKYREPVKILLNSMAGNHRCKNSINARILLTQPWFQRYISEGFCFSSHPFLCGICCLLIGVGFYYM